jgi:CheY-like chemotaxis protein
VLGDVLKTAIADGKTDLAAAAATALGKVTDTNALSVNGQVNPLVEALSAPGRRARFAAAKALVTLDPRKPFAGSSRVVPVLAQFVTTGSNPRALVIDGNPGRGGQLVSFLKTLGYDSVLAPTGAEGFRMASESADFELILLDHHLIQGDWRLHDTLANLKADARTAGIPVHVVGPLAREPDLASLTERFPGVRFIVSPTTPQILGEQLAIVGRPTPISAEERTGYAREAAALLAQIAARPQGPFHQDLARIEPELTIALSIPDTSLAASAALGDVADPDAQRGLADVLIDPSKPAELRLSAAAQLAKSAQRFGALVSADQEAKLLEAFDGATDPALRTALGTVIGALRPKAAPTGVRLRRLNATPNPSPSPSAPVSPASSSPEAQPSPSEPAPAEPGPKVNK